MAARKPSEARPVMGYVTTVGAMVTRKLVTQCQWEVAAINSKDVRDHRIVLALDADEARERAACLRGWYSNYLVKARPVRNYPQHDIFEVMQASQQD